MATLDVIPSSFRRRLNIFEAQIYLTRVHAIALLVEF